MWLGSTHPRSQCVGGMLLVQRCYKHVLNCLTIGGAWCNGDMMEISTDGVVLFSEIIAPVFY